MQNNNSIAIKKAYNLFCKQQMLPTPIFTVNKIEKEIVCFSQNPLRSNYTFTQWCSDSVYHPLTL